MFGALAVTVAGGFALKAQCLGSPWEGRQFARLCYNDIQPLYEGREIDERTFPYVDGTLRDGELVDGAVEYPVLTGLFMWFAGLFASDANEYLVATAVLLAAVAVLATLLLARMAGPRALLWAGAPAIAFYAFHNWDLLVVAAAVAGIWFWWRREPVTAAVLFGVGGAIKLYPLLFLAPLALEHWARRDRRGAALTFAAGVGTTALLNLPFLVLGPGGWWATYRFHQLREPNGDSTWELALSLSPAQVNGLSGALPLAGLVAVLAYAWRSRSSGAFPFLPACAALLAVSMLFGKVQSPQYTLWLLPFFVLLDTRLRWWLAYVAADALVYVGVFRWYLDRFEGRLDLTPAAQAMTIGVWGRAALLAVLAVVFLRSQPVLRPPLAVGRARVVPRQAAIESG